MAEEISIGLVEQKDCTFLVKWANAMKLRRQAASKNKTNAVEQQKFIEDVSKDPTVEFFIISKGASKKGSCELYDINYRNRTCKLSAYLDEDEDFLSLSGYKVIDFIVDHAFARLGLFKITVDVPTNDNIYQTLYKQSNFKSEVYKREHLFSDGKYIDIVELSLVKSDLGGRND